MKKTETLKKHNIKLWQDKGTWTGTQEVLCKHKEKNALLWKWQSTGTGCPREDVECLVSEGIQNLRGHGCVPVWFTLGDPGLVGMLE